MAFINLQKGNRKTIPRQKINVLYDKLEQKNIRYPKWELSTKRGLRFTI